MYEELIQRAKALDEKATPGPWMWDMRTAHHTCQLVTAHSGQYYVMQFSRWGMQDACPEFQRFKRYSGPVTERGGLGMVRADKMAKSYPGKEHHKGFDDYIDHPDAVFIAASRALVTELIEAVTALQSENAEKDKEIERLRAERDRLLDRAHEAQAERDCARAERDAAVALVDKVHEMLRPGEDGQGYGYAATNSVAYMVYAMIDEWRGAQGGGQYGTD